MLFLFQSIDERVEKQQQKLYAQQKWITFLFLILFKS
jgi:hypothetical protein